MTTIHTQLSSLKLRRPSKPYPLRSPKGRFEDAAAAAVALASTLDEGVGEVAVAVRRGMINAHRRLHILHDVPPMRHGPQTGLLSMIPLILPSQMRQGNGIRSSGLRIPIETAALTVLPRRPRASIPAKPCRPLRICPSHTGNRPPSLFRL